MAETPSTTRRLPQRRHLKRIPVWLKPDQSVVYFVTVCCKGRRPVFRSEAAVRIALESLTNASDALKWSVLQVCFMPDHIHMMVSPAEIREQSLSKLVQRWKSSSRQRLVRAGISGDIWQREYFDHLLRSNESMSDKWRYVEQNPVRAGLCKNAAEYAFLGNPDEIMRKLTAL